MIRVGRFQMARTRRFRASRALALWLTALALFASCSRPWKSSEAAASETVTAEAPATPETFSFAASLPASPLVPLATLWPDDPFPVSYECYRAAFACVGADGKRWAFDASGRPYAVDASSSTAPIVALSSPGRQTARRGPLSWTASGTRVELLDEVASSPRSADLPDRVLSGPIAVGGDLVVATARPALVVLDRATLAVKATWPLDRVADGPLWFFEDEGRLVLFHRDGSVGLYGVATSSPSGDPALLAIQPEEAALKAIVAKTGELSGRYEAFSFSAFELLAARPAVSASGFVLFRCESSAAGIRRLFVSGVPDRHYLIAVFDESGEFIVSNLGYSAEAVLEFDPLDRRAYFCSVGFLDEGSAAGAFEIEPRAK